MPSTAHTTSAGVSRRLAAALALAAVGSAGAVGSAHGADLLSARDAASFRTLQARLGGRIGLAVSPLGKGRPVERIGSLTRGVAWSTSKVPVAMAVIAAGGSRRQASDLRAAIAASDNAAAERLWSSLGGGSTAARAATRQLRGAGDRHTVVQSERLRGGFTAFGQTSWTVADQARFAAGLPCLSAGRAVLRLMGRTVRSQRWGLGRVDGAAQLKGGWGPGHRPGVDGGYLDRQLGIVSVRGTPIAVSIASLPGDGRHDTGTRNLTTIARWAVDHVDVRGVPAQPDCG